jgi:hypothetical protein
LCVAANLLLKALIEVSGFAGATRLGGGLRAAE